MSSYVLRFDDGIPTLAEVERRHIETTLACCGGNKSHAATMLGTDRRTLYRKLARYAEESRKRGKPESSPRAPASLKEK